jgi:ABC-type glycerol-3-phosphate transport system substrate-binding protein
MKRHLIAAAVSLCTATVLTLSGCAGAGSLGSGGDIVTIAMVSNSQMTDAIKLSSQFEDENPGIQLKFVTLPENQARQDHHVHVHRRQNLRRRHDQQLRNAAVGGEWVAS